MIQVEKVNSGLRWKYIEWEIDEKKGCVGVERISRLEQKFNKK